MTDDEEDVMKDEEPLHAPPDVLLDIAEGTVVEARWKQHVVQCESCSEEVENLEKTLVLAGKAQVLEPGGAYWRNFGSRLNERIQKDGKARKRVGRWAWAAAAAILVIGLWVIWYGYTPLSTPPDIAETVLPPADEDAEYQLLLSIAELIDGEEDWEEQLDFGLLQDLDPTQLTSEEQEQLRQELENDLEGENDAVS
jgi:hypothetical protein